VRHFFGVDNLLRVGLPTRARKPCGAPEDSAGAESIELRRLPYRGDVRLGGNNVRLAGATMVFRNAGARLPRIATKSDLDQREAAGLKAGFARPGFHTESSRIK